MNFIVIELHIKNCIRFLNKGTTEIIYTPKKELQLLLGSNGFGKSSLADYCSPLPPNKKMFIKGGYYRGKFAYQNNIYELEADFSSGAKYSFKINGQPNINDGRTFSIQKALVEKHFGYTQEIHDLLRGKVDFARMSTSLRKEWLLKLCPYDLSYAVKIEREANRQLNQLSGAIKKTKEKLVRAQSELISQSEIDEIQSSLQIRLQHLDEFSNFVNNQIRWDASDENDLCDVEASMRKHIDTIRTASFKVDRALGFLESANNIPLQVVTSKENVGFKLSETKAKLTSLYEEQLNLEQILKSSDIDTAYSDDELNAKLHALDLELSRVTPNMELLDYDNPQMLLQQLLEVAPLWENFLSRLPPNPNKELYSPTLMQGIEDSLTALYMDLNKFKNSRQVLAGKLTFIKEQSPIDCPECQHNFIPGIKPGEDVELTDKIGAIDKLILEVESKISNLEKERSKQDDYRSLMHEFQSITRDYPRLTMLWCLCHENMTIHNAPNTLAGKVGMLINDFYDIVHYTNLKEQRDRFATILENRALSKTANHAAITNRLTAIMGNLDALINTHSDLEGKFANLQSLESLLNTIKDASTNLEICWTTHQDKLLFRAKAEQAEIVNQNINQIKFSMVSLQDRLASNKSKQAVVDNLESIINEMVEEVRVLSLVTKVLNPFDGFIAVMMNNFISEFVGVMNGIATNIWSHTFIIYKCGMDQNGLDYKFPFLANPLNNKASDIADGSDGEVEFINFLFAMAARLYLKLEAWPLHLDEIGKYFTEQHRLRLYNFVKSLIEVRKVGQVFVISHFPSTHNTLTNADFNYIDPTGLTVPEGGNENLVLK